MTKKNIFYISLFLLYIITGIFYNAMVKSLGLIRDYDLVYANPVANVAADKVIDFELSKVLYELPTLSGETILMEADYLTGGPDPEIEDIRLSLMDANKNDGQYSYYLNSKQDLKIIVNFVYEKGELSDIKIEPEMELRKGWTKDNPFTLSVESKGGYEILFNFVSGYDSAYSVRPKVNPWSSYVSPDVLVAGQGADIQNKYYPENAPREEIETNKDKKSTAKSNLFSVVQNGRYGYIDKTGKLVIEPQFDEVFFENYFSEGLTPVQINKKWGYINEKGEVVIEPKFDMAYPFSEGLALVNIDWKPFFIDKKGDAVFEVNVGLTPSSFVDGLASVETGYIDKSGKLIIDGLCGGFDFSEGLAAVCVETPDGRRSGFIDKTGKMVIEPQFDLTFPFSEGLALVKTRDKIGYINKTGRFVIELNPICFKDTDPETFSYIDTRFHEGFALIYANYKLGYIDKTGKVVILPQFSHAFPFSEGLAAVEVKGKLSYITKDAELITEPKFDFAESFHNGLALVTVGSKRGYIDKTGKYIWNPTE